MDEEEYIHGEVHNHDSNIVLAEFCDDPPMIFIQPIIGWAYYYEKESPGNHHSEPIVSNDYQPGYSAICNLKLLNWWTRAEISTTYFNSIEELKEDLIRHFCLKIAEERIKNGKK